jgi:hypothetical protein
VARLVGMVWFPGDLSSVVRCAKSKDSRAFTQATTVTKSSNETAEQGAVESSLVPLLMEEIKERSKK